ncbi:ATP-binding protein [Gordoniibacillus kamchatkensis]|nr:ATP-binding protein [Paenibacillus sp. VKM B-2647]
MSLFLFVFIIVSTVRIALQVMAQPNAPLNEAVPVFALFFVFSLVAGSAVVFMIESIIDKHMLLFSLRQLSDSMPSSIVTVNRDGIITSVNRAFLHEYPLVADIPVVGRHFRVVTDLYGVDYRQTMLFRALAGEETRNAVVDYPEHCLLINAYPLRSPATGDIEGAISISRDITEVRELREKIDGLDRLSLVGQMAASVAHEIRNPMTSIRGFVQLMSERDRDSDHSHHGYYPIILEELDRVNGIIEDFLSLSRNRVVHKEPLNLNALVEESLPLLWAEANMNGIEIKLGLPEQLPELSLDRKEMKQLLLNLTHNAFEAMDRGGTLTLRTEADETAVYLRVSDTGCGMPREMMDRLFQPFFTTKQKGTGLGLAVCKNIVDRHNGRLDVRSEPGQGTTFTVVLPLK